VSSCVVRPGPAFSMASRHPDGNIEQSPGPAHYYAPVNDKGPHFSIGGRISDKLKAENPGPGAYSPEYLGPTVVKKGPAYSFGSKPRIRYSDDQPGM
jgi:hypothetical protein